VTAVTAAPFMAWAQEVERETGVHRPIDISKDGHLSDFLFNLTTISIGLLFIGMVIIIFWASFLHSSRAPGRALYDHGLGPKHLLFIAGVSSIIFFGLDGTLLYNSFVDLTEHFWKWPTAAEDPIEIEVLAQQWAWNIRYPGPDKKFGTADDVTTLNQMHIPVG